MPVVGDDPAGAVHVIRTDLKGPSGRTQVPVRALQFISRESGSVQLFPE